ncbi:helix-turn-helix transcriptional regulator [Leucobacter chromiireducens]|uniref:helix-turn-helix transcriptional regulator n=1 Tax=Leucobacter chromiireducens TaxID=283877 RepID=UPI000F6408A8|nr:helix-turn-helix transcriptional regulator [Leucobacter chromiireducens]
MPNNLVTRRWTTERWEAHLGEQVRRARRGEQWSQAELARRANVNRNSVSALERGEGSSLATLIRVVRALGRSDWLDALAPDPGPSPMSLLREQRERERGVPQQRGVTRQRGIAEPRSADA